MRLSRTSLHGRRGWSAVVGLSTVLTVLVAGQLPATADAAPLAPVTSVLGALVPSLAPTAAPAAPASVAPASVAPASAATTGSADDRRARTALAPTTTAPATRATVVRAVAKPAAKSAAKPAAAKPVAKPAASLCAGRGWEQRRGQAALASLKGGAARTGFQVAFAGARKGYLGLTYLGERRIEVFVRGCAIESDTLLRHVMAHELGHAYDTTRLGAATRSAWKAARGIPAGADWYGCSGCTDFATPAGDFAEVYAQWARGSVGNRSEIAGDVPAGQLAQLAQQFFGA